MEAIPSTPSWQCPVSSIARQDRSSSAQLLFGAFQVFEESARNKRPANNCRDGGQEVLHLHAHMPRGNM